MLFVLLRRTETPAKTSGPCYFRPDPHRTGDVSTPKRHRGESSRRSGRASRGRGRCCKPSGDPTAPHPPCLTPLPFPPSAPAAARSGCGVQRPPLHIALCSLLPKSSSAGASGISSPASPYQALALILLPPPPALLHSILPTFSRGHFP